MAGLDPYATLGVARDAPDFVVQAAYRACLKKYHPDHYSGSDARQRTADVLEAWRLIGTAQARAAYDRAHAGPSPGPPHPAQQTRRDAPRPAPPPSAPAAAPIPANRPHRAVWAVLGIAGVALIFWASQHNGERATTPPTTAITTLPTSVADAPPVAPTPAAPTLPKLDTLIAFKDPATCEMTDATERLFTGLTRIDQTDYVSSQGPPVSMPGFAAPLVPTFSRNRNAEPGFDIRDVEATLPTRGVWHGLNVSKIRYRYMEQSSFWEMQVRFLEPPAKVRATLNRLGFRLPAIGGWRDIAEPEAVRTGMGVEAIPGGAALTCGSSMFY